MYAEIVGTKGVRKRRIPTHVHTLKIEKSCMFLVFWTSYYMVVGVLYHTVVSHSSMKLGNIRQCGPGRSTKCRRSLRRHVDRTCASKRKASSLIFDFDVELPPDWRPHQCRKRITLSGAGIPDSKPQWMVDANHPNEYVYIGSWKRFSGSKS